MPLHENNYEEYFLLYIDNELSAGDRLAVEEFVRKNPSLGAELKLLTQSVFTPDEDIVFENKETLYREDKRRAIVLFPWWIKTAIAAAVLLFLGAGGWWYMNKTVPDADTAKPELAHAQQPSTPDSGKTEINALTSPGINKNMREANQQGREEQIRARNTARNKNGFKALAKNSSRVETKITPAEAPDDRQTAPRRAALPMYAVAPVNNTDDSPEPMDMPVKARDLATSDLSPAATTIKYMDAENLSGDNKIYFANTSFSKKNNLRVVFRKASRIIDRITTLQ